MNRRKVMAFTMSNSGVSRSRHFRAEVFRRSDTRGSVTMYEIGLPPFNRKRLKKGAVPGAAPLSWTMDRDAAGEIKYFKANPAQLLHIVEGGGPGVTKIAEDHLWMPLTLGGSTFYGTNIRYLDKSGLEESDLEWFRMIAALSKLAD